MLHIEVEPGKWVEFSVTNNLGTYIQQMQAQQKDRDKLTSFMEMLVRYLEMHRAMYRGNKKEDPNNFLALFYRAFTLSHDKFMRGNQDLQISCRRGCSHCCYMQVEISQDEGRYLSQHLKKNKIQLDRQYLVAQSKLRDIERYPGSPVAACVFLKDNQCSIYDQRPLNCRKYFVISPPEKCDMKLHNQTIVKKVFNIDAELMASAAYNETKFAPMAVMLLKFL